MKHSFIDKYSNLDSIIHKLDPRTKIIGFFSFVVIVVLTTPGYYIQLLGYSIVILSAILLSKVPLIYFFKRSLVVIPFILIISFFTFIINKDANNPESLNFFLNITIKSLLAVLSMILLSSTTNFTDLLKGLDKLRVPKIFIMLLSFMYRYIFLLIDETMRMQRARDSRYFGGKIINQIKTYANIIGTLFIRTFERGERVYRSMSARGFYGEIKTLNSLKFSKMDFIFIFIFLGSLIYINL